MSKFSSLAFASLLLLAGAGAANADEASDQKAFHDFLVQAKQTAHPDQDQVVAFYKTAMRFWYPRWKDYSAHPDNYSALMALYRTDQAIYPMHVTLDAMKPQRYQKDIDAFENFDAKNALPEKPALFVGSSSIMKWKTAEAFPGFSVINRGFGGSIIGDVQYYYKDVIGKYHPSAILFYCDNDIWNGGDPGQAFQKVVALYRRTRSDLPNVPFVFLGMKETPVDAFADPSVPASEKRFNALAKDFAAKNLGFQYFDLNTPLLDANGKIQPDLFQDGMHLNDKGYAIWNPLVRKLLISLRVPHAN